MTPLARIDLLCEQEELYTKQEIVSAIRRIAAEGCGGVAQAGKVPRSQHTCYLERSAVRGILVGQPDENLNITELVLSEIDALPIFTAEDVRGEAKNVSNWVASETFGPNGSGYFTAGIDILDAFDDGRRAHHNAIEFYAKDKATAEHRRDAVLALPSPAPSSWQPIKTAPKNGEPVLIYVPINTPDRRILSAYWTDAGWWICSGSIVLGKPTLWMPLPTPSLVPSTHCQTPGDQS